MEIPTNWLLTGEPFIAYRTRLDLLDLPQDELEVQSSRLAMLADPALITIVAELKEWPGVPLNSHKSAGHPLHKLSFLAEAGFCSADPGIDLVLARILERRSPEGPFQIFMNIPTHFGGTGTDQLTWVLCDAPLLVYALVSMGLEKDPMIQDAVMYLSNIVRENGWPCAASKDLGKFRGPGKKDDPCPYANLVMLKLLSALPDYRESQPARYGAEALLSLWSESRERHPYLFHTGTDFRKLKAPLIWYDLMHVLDVLARFPFLEGDYRLQQMVDLLVSKADDQGRFTPESVWTAWGDWEFGQKKTPSRWLTFLAWRVLRRTRVFKSPED